MGFVPSGVTVGCGGARQESLVQELGWGSSSGPSLLPRLVLLSTLRAPAGSRKLQQHSWDAIQEGCAGGRASVFAQVVAVGTTQQIPLKNGIVEG